MSTLNFLPPGFNLITSSLFLKSISLHQLIITIQTQILTHLPYICFKFVRQEAVGIYYIPWPPKKIAAQISYQVGLPKTAQICAACTANWPKLPKNELKKNIWYISWHLPGKCMCLCLFVERDRQYEVSISTNVKLQLKKALKDKVA